MACWIPTLELDCKKCSPGQQAHYGCEQDSYIEDRWEIDGEYYQRCPAKLITEETRHFVHAYNLLQLGGWPYSGGWIMNSNKLVEAMSIIDSTRKRLEADQMRKARK
jgi:hypothetical protein